MTSRAGKQSGSREIAPKPSSKLLEAAALLFGARESTQTKKSQNPMPEGERRKYPRVWIALPVRYAPRQYVGEVPPELCVGKTLNISRSGAALELPHKLHRGGHIEMSIIQEKPLGCVDVVGRVVRCEPMRRRDETEIDETRPITWLVGVEFTRLLTLAELRVLHEFKTVDAY